MIEVRLEYPVGCGLSDEELEKLLELYKRILKSFTCDDYDEMIQTWKEDVDDE